MAMQQRLSVVTLGVADLERALAFYRDLGFPETPVVGTEYPGDDTTPAGAVAMFEIANELTFALYPRAELAKDAHVSLEPATGSFSIGHFVATEAEVDALLARAEAAGATLTDTAHRRPWGLYSGYFRDPDGHLWEVIARPSESTS